MEILWKFRLKFLIGISMEIPTEISIVALWNFHRYFDLNFYGNSVELVENFGVKFL